jgi:hypothetical protein
MHSFFSFFRFKRVKGEWVCVDFILVAALHKSFQSSFNLCVFQVKEHKVNAKQKTESERDSFHFYSIWVCVCECEFHKSKQIQFEKIEKIEIEREDTGRWLGSLFQHIFINCASFSGHRRGISGVNPLSLYLYVCVLYCVVCMCVCVFTNEKSKVRNKI